jgi:hypothetical protein
MGFELKTLVVIGTDCTGSCKSNYHMITTTTKFYYSVSCFMKEKCEIISDINETAVIQVMMQSLYHIIIVLIYMHVHSNHFGRGCKYAYHFILYYLCNQCLSPLKFLVQIPFMARCTRYNIVLLVTGGSLGTLVCSTNKSDHHNITEILLKWALNTITLTHPSFHICCLSHLVCQLTFINNFFYFD